MSRLASLIALLFVLLPAAGAQAYWTSAGTGSGGAVVGTLSAPVVTVPASANNNVAVSWSASHVTPASASLDTQIKYLVERSSDGGSTWSGAAGTCAGSLASTTTSCSDAVSTAGSYVYRVTASFHSWTARGTSASVAVTTLQAPTLTTKPAAPSATTASTFAFNGGGGSGYECKLDGAAFAPCTSPVSYPALALGAHTFTVHGVQGAVVGPDTVYSWSIVTSAPVLGAKPSTPSANVASATIAFTHASYSSFQCKLDAGAYQSCTSPQSITTLNGGANLAAGLHTVTVRAVDGAGVATSTVAYTWTVNATAPTLSTTTPNPSASTTASFTFSHATYATLQCSLDGAAFSTCTSPKAYSALADGAHSFKVQALDADGAPTAAASFAWTQNTAAPTLTASPANPTTATSASFSFTDAGYGTFACKLDGGAFAACNSGTTSYAGPLAGGSHTFTVHALDGASVATADRVYSWTIGTPPVLTITSCTLTFGGSNLLYGTTTDNTGTVTVKTYVGIGTGGASAGVFTATITGGASPYTWYILPAAGTFTTGKTYTAQVSQVSGIGLSSNTLSCQFTGA